MDQHGEQASLFWLISVPKRKQGEDIYTELNRRCTQLSTMNYRFAIPELKVGNIDSLIALSDALKKVVTTTDQTLRKIVSAYSELQKEKPDAKGKDGSKIKELTPNQADLTRFGWNQARFPVKKPLPEITQIIKQQFQVFDKELKEKSIQFNTLKAKVVQLEQTQSGTLLTRDLNKDLAHFKPIESEYLTTLYVVVPKVEAKNWWKTYETLTKYVVPRSSQQITEDADYVLFSVVLFTIVSDEFKTVARSKKFTVRKNDPSSVMTEEEIRKLHSEYTSVCQKYEKWCIAQFSDGFSSWVHLKCIQCYVESILRFGLPPEFQATLLTPKKGSEKKLERTLVDIYSYLGDNFDNKDDDKQDEKHAAILGQEKFFPYVFLEMDLTFGTRKN